MRSHRVAYRSEPTEPTVPIGEGADGRRGIPDLAARFDRMEPACRAIERLERVGCDARMARRVSSRVARAVAIGAFVGLAVGGGVAAILLAPLTDPRTGPILVVCLLGGVLFGGLVGAMARADLAVGSSESWRLRSHDGGGRAVWVLVFDASRRAREALAACQPAEIHRPVDRDDLVRLVGRG